MTSIPQIVIPLALFTLFFSFGCAKKQHTYITPDGAKVVTSDIGLQTMAIRDTNIAAEQSYNDALKGATDVQAVALMANKLTQRGQKIERESTVSEEAREWAGLFLRYFGGGIDVNNRKRTEVHSQVYNINGDGNTMAHINNLASSQQGDVRQELSSDSTPNKEETTQTWLQDGTQGSANGTSDVDNSTKTDTKPVTE